MPRQAAHLRLQGDPGALRVPVAPLARLLGISVVESNVLARNHPCYRTPYAGDGTLMRLWRNVHHRLTGDWDEVSTSTPLEQKHHRCRLKVLVGNFATMVILHVPRRRPYYKRWEVVQRELTVVPSR